MRDSKYDTDFYAWANEQAALIRSGRLDVADLENIAEEIESLGKSERRELVSRLAVLLLHLLKWKYQPVGRSSSWETSTNVQRLAIEDHLSDNPSLKAQMPEVLRRAFRGARLEAAGETKLLAAMFPECCEWSFDQIMNPDFWPNGPDEKEVPYARRQI